MVLIKVQRLLVRNGWLYYRRKVPKDVRDVIGIPQWKESLGLRENNSETSIALRKIAKLNRETDAQISAARAVVSGEVSNLDLLQAREASRTLARTMGYPETPGERPNLVVDDNRENQLRELWERGEERLIADGLTENQLEEARQIDAITPVGQPPREDGLFRLLLSSLTPTEKGLVQILRDGALSAVEPPRLSTAYAEDILRHGGERQEKPIRYAVESFNKYVDDPRIDQIKRSAVQSWCDFFLEEDPSRSPSTLKKRIGSLRAIIKRAYVRYDIDRTNPFDGTTLPKQRNQDSKRLPFTHRHLTLIDHAIAGGIKLHDEDRLFLQFLKFTGAIHTELTGLTIDDFHEESGIRYIWIGPNNYRTQLKTEYRRRQIPIADALLPSVDIVLSAAIASKQSLVFPRAAKDTHSLSARLNKKIREAGVPKSTRLVCYSFRHGLKEALRRAGIQEAVQRSLLGHSGKEVADNYGAPSQPLKSVKDALETALPYLGDVPLHVYTNEELGKT